MNVDEVMFDLRLSNLAPVPGVRNEVPHNARPPFSRREDVRGADKAPLLRRSLNQLVSELAFRLAIGVLAIF